MAWFTFDGLQILLNYLNFVKLFWLVHGSPKYTILLPVPYVSLSTGRYGTGFKTLYLLDQSETFKIGYLTNNRAFIRQLSLNIFLKLVKIQTKLQQFTARLVENSFIRTSFKYKFLRRSINIWSSGLYECDIHMDCIT